MNTDITSAEARNNFPDLISQANYAKKRTIITRRGKRVAAIIPIEDLERLLAIEDEIDMQIAEEVLKNEEFEDWNTAKIDIMNHIGFTEDDLRTKDIEKSDKIHKNITET